MMTFVPRPNGLIWMAILQLLADGRARTDFEIGDALDRTTIARYLPPMCAAGVIVKAQEGIPFQRRSTYTRALRTGERG